MRKKVLSIIVAIILILQSVLFVNVFATDEKISLDLSSYKGSVVRGSRTYGTTQINGVSYDNILTITPGFTSRQTSTYMYYNYAFSSNPDYSSGIDASVYRYAVIEYYKTDDETTMRFRPMLNGSMKYISCNGTSNQWHRAVWEMVPAGSSTSTLTQFHFTPFHEQDANAINDEKCYIKSIEFYKENPLTAEEIALNQQIEQQIAQQYENIKGEDEELAVFEDLDKLDKTEELLTDPSFENSSSSWVAVSSTLSFETGDGAYDGTKYAKISGRTNGYSGIQQNIKDVLNTHGPGDYRISAFIKNDTDSASTYEDYRIVIYLNSKDSGYSTYHITDEWQQINGALRLSWTGTLTGAAIRICSRTSTENADFYVDNVSMKKCLYNEQEATHTAYIDGRGNGTFLPNANITRAETAAAVARLLADESSFEGLYTSSFTDVLNTHAYYDHIAYLEHLGLLTQFGTAFNPDTNITRAEFAYLVNNIATLTGSNSTNFTDVESTNPLYNDIVTAITKGYMTIYSDNTFRPDANITRADAVTMINDATERYPVPSSYTSTRIATFTDVNEFCAAYDEIVEATTTHTATIYDKGDKFVEAWHINSDNYDTAYAVEIQNDANQAAETLKNQILNASDNLTITGTRYYVSNSGNDSNSGLSPDQAWATINKVNNFNFSNGDAVLFERGGLWRGATVFCQSGVTYAAYGSGEKPRLYGSDKNYADPALWVETDTENVWKTTENFTNVGFLNFDGYIMSQKVFSSTDLNQNFNFMQSSYSGVPVLLYYDGGNPGDAFSEIEIAPEYSIFIANNKENIRIDNICMRYTGWHGVKFANVENIEITNCEVGWIGGTGGSASSRWGNGIEFWENCNNTLVDHCYVYQVFDAGVTNQWKGEVSGVVVEQNVEYTNNLIEYCTYAYEFFMNQPNSNSAIMKNVSFSDNICRYTGCGWGQDNRYNKTTSADIKGWNSLNRTENFVVENNIFLGSNLSNVHYGSYSNNIPGGTQSYNNKLPQHLIKLNGNTYINSMGKTFADYNFFTYISNFDVNKAFIRDNVDVNGKLVLVNTENIIQNSSCDDLTVWTNSGGTLAVETSGDNAYLALSGRTKYYNAINQRGIATKLNEYGAGTYQLSGRIKIEDGDASTTTTAEAYLIASSYNGTYSPYTLCARINGVSDEWQYFTVTFDTSTLPFTTWPSDANISFREKSTDFVSGSKLCIDDICLVPINTVPNAE